jgi:NitT/TauT family transport system substrate-binding protein
MNERMQRSLFAAALVAATFIPGTVASAATRIALSYSQRTVDFLPLLIANDAGYFKNHGLDVSMRYLPAEEGIPALISGQEQMAGIGGSDAMSAEAQGAKLKLVLTFTPTYIFQFWARPDHATASTLKGQRVGITSSTGSLYAATLLALKQLGLTTSDVVIAPLGGVTNINSALLAGSIAAGESHPPATYKFKQAGLIDLVDLAKEKVPSVNAGVWFTQAYVQAHREIVQDMVDAVLDAIRREKSDRAYAESEITKELGIKDKGELDFTYDFYVNEVLAVGTMPQVAELQSNADALVAKNPKIKNVDVADMIDTSFLKKAEKNEAAK